MRGERNRLALRKSEVKPRFQCMSCLQMLDTPHSRKDCPGRKPRA